MAEEQAAASQEQAQQQFVMQRIYNKDLSFESPSTPDIFKRQWQPKVNVDLNTRSTPIDEQGNFEVVLSITLTAKVDDDTAFLVEVQQAGIFFIIGFEGRACVACWARRRRISSSPTRARTSTRWW
jgi:preprotein translocase subunit SecB